MKSIQLTVVALSCLVVLSAGCAKKVRLTIANHSSVSRTIQLTAVDETMTLGAVGADSRLTSTLKVKTADLPAQCNISAGAGASQSFTVTEDSPSKWWFHITRDGRLVGPYGKNDEHVETEDRGTIEVPIERRMLLK